MAKEMRWRRKDVDRGSSWTMRLPNSLTRFNPSLPQTPVVSIATGIKSMCCGKSVYLVLFLIRFDAKEKKLEKFIAVRPWTMA